MQRHEDLSENDVRSLAGCDIVVYGYAALAATDELLSAEYDRIAERTGLVYAERIRYNVASCVEKLAAYDDAVLSALSREDPDTVIWRCGDDGVYGALWHMTAASHIGMHLDVRQVPLRQESIELCNMFDLNPYRAKSSGCMILTSGCGARTAEIISRVTEGKLPCVIAGYTLKGKEKLLINREEVQYLTRPEC